MKVFLAVIILSATVISVDEEFRVIDLDLFEHENSYLPVRPGSKFIIEAKGNITTGYSWYLHDPSKLHNKSILKALNLNEHNSGDYYQHPEENERVGAEGIFHFKFEASKENLGMEQLIFHYKRPFSEEDMTIKVVNVNVVKINNSDL